MTSRRNFIGALATTLFGFTILPPATTYERVWKAEKVVRCFTAREMAIYLDSRLSSYDKLFLEQVVYPAQIENNPFGNVIFDSFPFKANNA